MVRKAGVEWSRAEIGAAGERAVALWFRGEGFSVYLDTKGAGSTDVEARHPKGAHHLVQVKSALYPNVPAELSSDELRNIKSRAARVGAQPWHALVVLYPDDLSLLGDIVWRKLA